MWKLNSDLGINHPFPRTSQVAQVGVHLPIQESQEMQVQSLVRQISCRRKWQPDSSTVARIILWTEEPDGLPSMRSKRVGHTEQLSTHPFPNEIKSNHKKTKQQRTIALEMLILTYRIISTHKRPLNQFVTLMTTSE